MGPWPKKCSTWPREPTLRPCAPVRVSANPHSRPGPKSPVGPRVVDTVARGFGEQPVGQRVIPETPRWR